MSTQDRDKPAQNPLTAPAAGAAPVRAPQPSPLRPLPSQRAPVTRAPPAPSPPAQAVQPPRAQPPIARPAVVPPQPAPPPRSPPAGGPQTAAAPIASAPKVPESIEELSLAPDLPFPDLALEDTAALRKRGVAVGASPVSGYNPYDTGPPAAARATRAPSSAPSGKRTDLRKLSEWIRLQRQVDDLKKGGGEKPE